ncbi:MAG: hypothetical protein QMD94_04405 [Candidatus Omnitrophota bacterium]|nr:hypothetical protein [Candidatus Omnitrophota bacterium]
MSIVEEKKTVPGYIWTIKTCAIYGITIIFGLIIANFIFTYLSSQKCLVKKRNIPVDYAKTSSRAPAKPALTVNAALSTAAKQELPTPISTPLKDLSPSPVPSIKNELPNKVSEEKRATLVLNGIFIALDNCYAIINNRIVKKGGVLEGATLIGISADEAELEAGGIKFKLSIKK